MSALPSPDPRPQPGRIPLRQFFDQSFKPARLAGRCRGMIESHSAAIDWLARALSREPLLADLTRDNLAAVQRLVAAHGFSATHCRHMKTRLSSMAKYAWRIGLLESWAPSRWLRAIPTAELPAVKREDPPQPGTLRHFFETEYVPTRLIGASPRTAPQFRKALRSLNEHVGHEVLLSELNDRMAADFFTWLLSRGWCAVSVNGHRRMIFAVWRMAAERGQVPREPRVRKLKESLDPPDAWSEDETRALFDAPLRMDWPRHFGGIPAGPFFRAVLLVGYWTGLRRGTLLKLRRGDVNLETGWLRVPGTMMKNRQGKSFRLGADALAALRAIWLPERELLFPFPHRDPFFSACFRRILRAAGIPPSARRAMGQMHKLRRTVATLIAIRKGLYAASELLGHSSLAMTKRYVDSSKLPGNDATELLPALTGPAASIGAGPAPAPTPAGLLAEAYQLLALGHCRPCMMTLRVALELLLKEWCEGAGGAPRDAKRHNLAGFAQVLHGRGIIDADRLKLIRRLAHLGNCAAHGAAPDAEKARELLAGIEQLLSASGPR